MTSLTVRPAVVGDVPAMVAIYAPLVRDTVISFEFEPPGVREFAGRVREVTAANPWLVYERDGMIAGYAYATPFRSRAAYAGTRETTVYVHPDHRRAGVARVLMRTLIEAISQMGTRLIVAGVTLPNPPSVALHESLGFSPVGVFRDAGRKFGAWHDVGFWQLRILD